MDDLEDLWPDPDLREDALYRLAERLGLPAGGSPQSRATWHEPPPESLTPAELRALEVVSYGVGFKGAAELVGVTTETIKAQLKSARRRLRARNTTHAVAIALRQGLIS